MSEQRPETSVRKCAICGKPQDAAFRPFCSRRCADIDLGKWLNEGYAIPGGEAQEEDGEADED